MKQCQVITYDRYSGSDEKLEYSTIKEAENAAQQYMRDGYDGAMVYDLKEWRIIREYGYFTTNSKPIERQRIFFMEHQLDLCKLMPKAELLAYLQQNGSTDHTLADIREKYEKELGVDPIWRFPLSDGKHMGTIIVPVREGFLSLPYDEVDAEENEIYLPDDACLMDTESCDTFCKDLTSYTVGFCSAMQEAKAILEFKKNTLQKK